MSINYEIEERIAIEKATEANREFTEIIADHIRAIGEGVRCDRAQIACLKVETDSKQFNLTADSSIACWSECSAAVSECESLKLFSNYEYIWRTDLSDCDNVGPFELMQYADAQDEKFLASILYETYNYADCSEEGCGIYCAYGYKDGHRYCGEVAFKEVSVLPEGEWYTPDTPQGVDDDFADKSQFDEILNACRNLDTLCEASEEYPNLRIKGENIEYFLNNPVIRSESDAKKLSENLAVLLKTNGVDSQEICFWDRKQMCMLKLIVSADGSCKTEIAALYK